MLSMPMALERREPRGPGRRRDGLFPGTSSACGAPLTGGTPGTRGTPRRDREVPTSSTEPSPMALPRRPRRLPGTSSDWGRHRVTDWGPGGGGNRAPGVGGHWAPGQGGAKGKVGGACGKGRGLTLVARPATWAGLMTIRGRAFPGCGMMGKGRGLRSRAVPAHDGGVAWAGPGLSHAPADGPRAQRAGPKPGGVVTAKGRGNKGVWSTVRGHDLGGDSRAGPGRGPAPQASRWG